MEGVKNIGAKGFNGDISWDTMAKTTRTSWII
jgi:hypothetical protein